MGRNNLRERFLRTAKNRFLQDGFHKTSMDSLAKELKTSKSSVYNHFSSKEDLVKAIIERLDLEINSELELVLNNNRLDFKNKLISIFDLTINRLSSISDKFFKDLESVTPDVWDYYQETRKLRINKYYKRLFEIGKSEGEIRDDINIDLVVTIYLHLTKISLTSENINNLHMSSQLIYKEITDVFLSGVFAGKD